jgi:hypothetical protein
MQYQLISSKFEMVDKPTFPLGFGKVHNIRRAWCTSSYTVQQPLNRPLCPSRVVRGCVQTRDLPCTQQVTNGHSMIKSCLGHVSNRTAQLSRCHHGLDPCSTCVCTHVKLPAIRL